VTVPTLIAAIDVFEDDHDVVGVTELLLLPLEYVAVAVQVPDVPSLREEGQETARPVSTIGSEVPTPATMNLPTPRGLVPTGMGDPITVFVAVFMTVTLLLPLLIT
jgi:hypothetical protein